MKNKSAQQKTPTVIRTEPELDRLAAHYSKALGCKLKNNGSHAFFYRVAAKRLLLEMSPVLRNIKAIDWSEIR